ncbi:MAG: 30S ribosomal protein S9 [Planctomycetes bacterium]|nr:30S ribosomal protein S9 [Planctomycetota bacterium]MCK5578142.1 30S ribosomal protein S9 [Planctomycetota bacterium]
MEKLSYRGTGRRKSAVARVILKKGTGKIIVNKHEYTKYFVTIKAQRIVLQPLEALKILGRYDVQARVTGGGKNGQAGAFRLGLARALKKADDTFEVVLRKEKFLTRDPRMKERKKYGRHGARRGTQFSKR